MNSRRAWTAVAAAIAGAWPGMLISVLGWLDEPEPLAVWFRVSIIATAIGACSGLGLVAATAVAGIRRPSR